MPDRLRGMHSAPYGMRAACARHVAQRASLRSRRAGARAPHVLDARACTCALSHTCALARRMRSRSRARVRARVTHIHEHALTHKLTHARSDWHPHLCVLTHTTTCIRELMHEKERWSASAQNVTSPSTILPTKSGHTRPPARPPAHTIARTNAHGTARHGTARTT